VLWRRPYRGICCGGKGRYSPYCFQSDGSSEVRWKWLGPEGEIILENEMRNLIPPRLYVYDFKRLFVIIAITAAVAVIVFSVLFGSIW
jgi:hypothetical protein